MKKLYTCGDSFMSCDYPATETISFLDRFSEIREFEHISLAKSGSTNFCVRTQIDEAIRAGADYVIIGATTSDRLDLPKPTDRKTQSVGRVRGFFNDLRQWHKVLWPTNKLYNQNVGLRTFEYRGYGCRSEKYVHNSSADSEDWATTLSDSINNIVTDLADNNIHGNTDRAFPKELRLAIEDYVLWIHDESYAQQRDRWILQSALFSLEQAKIPYVFIPGPQRKFSWEPHAIVWPNEIPQPWDRPGGFNEDSITHVFNAGHEELCESLLNLTAAW